ncbi:MAG: cytochrome c biogenesis CcdA family protein [Methyloligellaceae bacterium]
MEAYLTAVFGGFISFLSPCVLPLVPFYLAYLGGTTISEFSKEEGLEKEAHLRVIIYSIIFVMGFTTVFVAFGAAANSAFQYILGYRDILSKVGGVILILFGIHFLGLFKIPFLYREARFHMSNKPTGFIGAYLMGLAFAFGWTPCITPVLTPILGMAASADNFNTGVSLLVVYSLGLGIPFVLAAVAIGPFMGFMKGFQKHMGKVEKIMGIFLIVAGILFLTGSIQAIGTWLIDTFPVLSTFG